MLVELDLSAMYVVHCWCSRMMQQLHYFRTDVPVYAVVDPLSSAYYVEKNRPALGIATARKNTEGRLLRSWCATLVISQHRRIWVAIAGWSDVLNHSICVVFLLERDVIARVLVHLSGAFFFSH